MCPECGQAVPRHDTRTRRWRHLDTCHERTIIEAGVPRTSCPKHGTLTMRVSWADGIAQLTALFEALVIDWLREGSDCRGRGAPRSLVGASRRRPGARSTTRTQKYIHLARERGPYVGRPCAPKLR
ncbi:transposase family protein [Nannocystis pusilla]|uniref:transposase family protein n=1 Tax=Nannocystis pusilla TaxID=889268 RepID=UPI003DA1CD00